MAGSYLRRVGAEDLYTLPDELAEGAIDRLDESPAVKGFLRSWHANRALVGLADGSLYPAWYADRSKSFGTLTDPEKQALRDLMRRSRAESEQVWEERGRALLAELRDATDMLVCAEDLGDVPRIVPEVLADLGILSLRIVRWSRDWDRAGPGVPAPFIPPARYPWLSVCTPSVHDTSTLRGWWEEDAAERELFYRTLGVPGPCPERMTPALLQAIVRTCLGAGSALCILQVQDLLDLDQDLWAIDPRQDRVNVPGTVTDQNWTWRMPLPIEKLAERAALNRGISGLVAERRNRRKRP